MLSIGSKESVALYYSNYEINHLNLSDYEIYDSNIPEYLKAFKKVSTITKELVDSLNMQDVEEVIIPKNVITIDSSAFQGYNKIKSFSISNSVTSIGNYAFQDCTGLMHIALPESIESIGYYAFSGCSSLTHITVPSKIDAIKHDTFYNCSNLESIEILCPSITIDYRAFKGCSNLSNFDWNKIKALKDTAYVGGAQFEGCSKLTNFYLPKGVGFGNRTFYGCYNLASLTVDPNHQTYYSPDGSNAIFSRSQIILRLGCKNTIIPNNSSSIQLPAFSGCSSLTSITIPASIKNVAVNTFEDCSGLASIIVESDNEKLDSRDNCNAIINTSNNYLLVGCKNTIIPNSVKGIIEGAFAGCSGLISITIPNSVTTIRMSAFKNCNGLTSVIIPNSITSIHNDAFLGCNSLILVEIEQDFGVNLNISSGNYTPEVMINIFNNLKDLTDTSSKTLTLGSTNLAKLTEEQKAIATNKNWVLE